MRRKPCQHKRRIKTRKGHKTILVNKGVRRKVRKDRVNYSMAPKVNNIQVDQNTIDFWGTHNVKDAIKKMRSRSPKRKSISSREVEIHMEGKSKDGMPFYDESIQLGPKGEAERGSHNRSGRSRSKTHDFAEF